MTALQRRLIFGATVVAGLGLLALSAYLGLEKADKAASIASAIFGLIGVALGAYQLLTQQGASRATTSQSQTGGDGAINIMGGNDVNIGDRNTFGK
ncbi:hypothetical protein [Streptomyces sp. NPDC054958]